MTQNPAETSSVGVGDGELPDADRLLAIADRLANLSRSILRGHFRRPIPVDWKSDASPVTRADREAEAAMRAVIERELPEHGILGEEHGTVRGDAEYVWVLDPLDGTRAFVVGKPTFGSLIALTRRGRPVLGVIEMPILGERWVGCTGRPTTLNGTRCSVRSCESLGRAHLNTTSPAMFKGAAWDSFTRVRDAAAGCNYGGDCYGYGLVASGWLDATIENEMQVYDFLPLVPVVEGAGGRISDWAGRPLTMDSDGSVLACGDARVHAEALARISG